MQILHQIHAPLTPPSEEFHEAVALGKQVVFGVFYHGGAPSAAASHAAVQQAEFYIPEDLSELADWLELDMEGDADLRKIRNELRGIAKENSIHYEAVN